MAKKKKKELLQRKKVAIQTAIARQKLLQAIVSRQREGRPVNIMRRVSDKIPDVFTNPEKKKPTFFSRRGLI